MNTKPNATGLDFALVSTCVRVFSHSASWLLLVVMAWTEKETLLDLLRPRVLMLGMIAAVEKV